MPNYQISAQRTTYYTIDIEAADESEAEDKVFHEDLEFDLDSYAVDWDTMEVTDVQEFCEDCNELDCVCNVDQEVPNG
jgi:hypothetical protein